MHERQAAALVDAAEDVNVLDLPRGNHVVTRSAFGGMAGEDVISDRPAPLVDFDAHADFVDDGAIEAHFAAAVVVNGNAIGIDQLDGIFEVVAEAFEAANEELAIGDQRLEAEVREIDRGHAPAGRDFRLAEFFPAALDLAIELFGVGEIGFLDREAHADPGGTVDVALDQANEVLRIIVVMHELARARAHHAQRIANLEIGGKDREGPIGIEAIDAGAGEGRRIGLIALQANSGEGAIEPAH
jgi:hypothetical protein